MMKYEIWQLNDEIPGVHDIIFEAWDEIEKPIMKYAYKKVYSGNFEGKTLDSLFEEFNINHPKDYRGRSMSMSDIIVIKESHKSDKAYYVDRFCFKDISVDWWNAAIMLYNIQYVSTEYSNMGHTAEHVFTATVNQTLPITFTYSVTRHDGDEESFHLYSNDIDLWELIPANTLQQVSIMLDEEAIIGRYRKKMEDAKTMDELKLIEFEFMEDDRYPKRANVSFWNSYHQNKERIRSAA